MARGLRIALLSGTLLALSVPAAHASLGWNTNLHDYGSRDVGTSVSQTFTMNAMCDTPDPMMMTQCGSPPAGFHSFGFPMVSGEGYALGSPNTCMPGVLNTPTYPGAANCQTTVVFTPTSAGTKPGSLSTAMGPDITLTGMGVAAVSPVTPGTARTKKCKKKKGKKGATAAKKKCGKKRK